MQVGNARYRTAADIPDVVPVFPLKGRFCCLAASFRSIFSSRVICRWWKMRWLASESLA
ncbi:ATP-dependent protease La [Brucella abortus]|nr:ATP-dependent protease La [Brucella abortus]